MVKTVFTGRPKQNESNYCILPCTYVLLNRFCTLCIVICLCSCFIRSQFLCIPYVSRKEVFSTERLSTKFHKAGTVPKNYKTFHLHFRFSLYVIFFSKRKNGQIFGICWCPHSLNVLNVFQSSLIYGDHLQETEADPFPILLHHKWEH